MSQPEWTTWTGGACPVPADTLVVVQDRDGHVWEPQRADFHPWSHDTGTPAVEVVRYYIVGSTAA